MKRLGGILLATTALVSFSALALAAERECQSGSKAKKCGGKSTSSYTACRLKDIPGGGLGSTYRCADGSGNVLWETSSGLGYEEKCRKQVCSGKTSSNHVRWDAVFA